jgi:type I restriction enzyme, S subunit
MISLMKEKQGYKETELGWIPEDWDIKKLSEVTDIRLSNVDKKSLQDEIPVRLCNYMDVYKNRYIKDSFDLSVATAKENQIERFLLQPNDVIITKDSETQDDIGIPAVVLLRDKNV